MRRSVVDVEVVRTPADIDAQFEPRKRLLENPLPEISGEEKTVRPSHGQGGKEAEMSDREVLRLIDNGEVERRTFL